MHLTHIKNKIHIPVHLWSAIVPRAGALVVAADGRLLDETRTVRCHTRKVELGATSDGNATSSAKTL